MLSYSTIGYFLDLIPPFDISWILFHLRTFISDLILPLVIGLVSYSTMGQIADLIPPTAKDLIPPLDMFGAYSSFGHGSFSTIGLGLIPP